MARIPYRQQSGEVEKRGARECEGGETEMVFFYTADACVGPPGWGRGEVCMLKLEVEAGVLWQKSGGRKSAGPSNERSHWKFSKYTGHLMESK